MSGRPTIEIVYDFVCPWCHLGIARLLDAVASRPAYGFDLVWRPFLLNPDMPRDGLSRSDHALRKYGGEVRARRLYVAVTRLGQQDGVVFRFDRMARVPSSIDAHRLVLWAQRLGDATPLVRSLFDAHFADGDDLGNHDILAGRAARAGFDPVAAQQLLSTRDGEDAVHAENLRAHRAGIAGVPCVVMDNSMALAGVQDTKVFQRLLDVAALERITAG